MRLKRLEISGFKSFAKKSVIQFEAPISAIVGPNGSGKSNVAESIRFALGEQSIKSLRGKRGEDLIWNGSKTTPRSNLGSVSLVFDNTKKIFEYDYDEISLRRDVHRDGVNEYFINNSQVRLKDIHELLSRVNIGASSHHIISQGEADRVLSANPKERRAMVEEALGLKIYQWKIAESEKKLDKTEENIKQVESLRKEIAPHIKFLKKQVEKIEQGKAMQDELGSLYAEYLKKEEGYLKRKKTEIESRKKPLQEELKSLEKSLEEARRKISESATKNEKGGALVELEKNIEKARQKRDEIGRRLGRIEGMIELEEKRLQKSGDKGEERKTVPLAEISAFASELDNLLNEAHKTEDISFVRDTIKKIKELVRGLISKSEKGAEMKDEIETAIKNLKSEKSTLEKELAEVSEEEKKLEALYRAIRGEIEAEKDSSRDTEKEIFKMMGKKAEISASLSSIGSNEELLLREEEIFKEEIKEGGVLVGRSILNYREYILEVGFEAESREIQGERRKKIEKIKIRLEDLDGGGEDVLKEYQEVFERDKFLENELQDLESGKESLKSLIAELAVKLDHDFKEGVNKINSQFQDFFALMFGGGEASLSLVAEKKKKKSDYSLEMEDYDAIDEDEDVEEGIEINISLPRKKIRGLQMLSGGERALTSIALIFALSQVNPPPFLVLDETDAALDEANSRKYGDMLENLSKHSQLIVITHNRETMSRAGILYGITMGQDAASKLLSVKFDEAVEIAK